MNGDIKIAEKNILEKWEDDFYQHYNESYRFYLNGHPPMIFMHYFLEKIIKTTDSSAGFIASILTIDNKIFTNIEAVYKDKLYDDSALFHNWQINLDSNSICNSCLKKEIPVIINDLNVELLFDEPIHPPPYCKSYVCIPYKFNDKIIGILGLFNKKNISSIELIQDDEKILSVFKMLGSLIGTLQNSYFKVKTSNGYSDKKIITYQLLEDILNTVHDGILIVDEKYNIVHNNIYSTELFSNLYLDKKNECENLLEIFPQLEETCEPLIKKIFKNKKTEIIIEDNYVERVLEFIFNTVVCGGHFYHLVTIHNIKTDSKNHVKNKGMNTKCLMAFLSHELRNPLQSITLANHLVKSNIKSQNINVSMSDKFLSYFDIINKSCQDMKKIINDVLDLSKIELGEFVIDMECCEINEIVDFVINENINDAKTKKLQIIKQISDNVPSFIYTDPTRTTQILSNLITNAIKYSNSGTITIKILCDDFVNVKFSVEDEGMGIKHGEMSKLFNTYGQTITSKGKLNSHGLGLCVSQKIANLMGGKITVKSEYNKGSVFSFYHPIKLGMSGCKYETSAVMGILTGNILLVDDNSDNLLLLHTLLDQFNYEYVWGIKIESVDCGYKAIELCKFNNYDIIFMDINMPGINGNSASKIIRNNGFTGKIIATTGNILLKHENKQIENESNENNLCENFDDVIIKPFDDQTVLKTLKKIMLNVKK